MFHIPKFFEGMIFRGPLPIFTISKGALIVQSYSARYR